MTNRSTRNKIRWQAQKAADQMDRALEHLKYLDDLSAGQSSLINETLPLIVQGIDKLKAAILNFRDRL